MRIVFAGTPDFAVPALEALARAGHDLAGVLTQPDRPAGRGLAPAASPVKAAAARLGIPVLQPASLKTPEAQGVVRALAPDALVVAAYGLILPQAVLDIPPLGAINIHASLLPRWRGAAPIQRALLAGDRETGISIMRMEAALDTGPVLLCEAVPILPGETAGTLHDKLAALGARLVVAALDGLGRGTLAAAPQPADGATYAAKLDKREARIDWTRPAAEIERQVRAFNPFPGATARVRGTEVKIWRAVLADGAGEPGAVIAIDPTGIMVASGAGALRLEELQRAGGKRLPAREFLRGFPLAVGERLEPAATNGNI
jgi:methionyl-tRNA formyltransferase